MPALTPSQFVDGGWSTLARMLPYMEGGNSFNALNFNLSEYNDANGANLHRCLAGRGRLPLPLGDPLARRRPRRHRPQRRRILGVDGGYGYNDYGPTVYTDISPLGVGRTSAPSPATPYRDKTTRANGLLKQGKTADRRDHRRHQQHDRHRRGRRPRSPLPQPLHRGVLGRRAHPCRPPWLRSIPTTRVRRAVNPLSPLLALGRARRVVTASPAPPITSIAPITKARRLAARPAPFIAQGNNAGNNDELASFHPGGVKSLFGDGSVAFLKDSVNVVTLRGLVTPQRRRSDLLRPVLIRIG